MPCRAVPPRFDSIRFAIYVAEASCDDGMCGQIDMQVQSGMKGTSESSPVRPTWIGKLARSHY